MSEKRELRKDLPKREFDSDLNSPALSNVEDNPVDQRDSVVRQPAKKERQNDAVPTEEHDVGGADNLSR